MEIVKLLLENGFKINDRTVADAAQNGHFQIANYLLINGAKIANTSLFDPVSTNNFAATKFLLAKGAKISNSIVEIAAVNGHLEMVKLLLENGGKMDNFAVLYDNGGRAEFFVENANKMTYYGAKNDLKNAHFKIVRLLVKNGYKIYNLALINAVARGDEEIVKFLMETENQSIANNNFYHDDNVGNNFNIYYYETYNHHVGIFGEFDTVLEVK